MNLRTAIFAVAALCAVLVVGCSDFAGDRPVPPPESTTPASPAIDAAEPGNEPDTEPGTEPDSPPPEMPEAATDPPPEPPADVAEDLDAMLEEIAVLEQNAKFFEAFTRVRDLSKTYRDRPEGAELVALQQRLYKCHRRSSGLDFAIGQLGSDSDVAVSVATEKLLAAEEVGMVYLRKAVRQGEPRVATAAAGILIEQDEPQIIRLMVERMEQDPPEPLGDDLGQQIQHLETVDSEWIDRLCDLARRKGPGQSGAVSVLIDRLERSIALQLETTKPGDEAGDAPEKDETEQPEPAAVEVDPRLVRTLYDVAVTAEGALQRQVIDVLLMSVLEQVNHRDGQTFNQLLANDDAHGFLGDYVVTNLESEQLADRIWAISRAPLFGLQAPGFWAGVQGDDGSTVLHERVDPTLSFADVNALRATGPVEQGQTIRWTGFVNVPADGKYTFSVDCADASATTLFVNAAQTTADEPVELTSGWHEVRAETSLSGDEARIHVAWEGPELAKENIPAERVACVDRTRMLVWQLGRGCDLAQAHRLVEQLLPSLGRVDKELAEQLIGLAAVDEPAGPALAVAVGELLDHSIENASEPPEWEIQALSLLLGASDKIAGPEQRRVVASLVNHLARRAGSQKAEFNTQADSPEAYDSLRALVAQRLDDPDPEIARWAMQHAGPVQLALQGLWAKTYARPDPADESGPLDERLSGSLNYADPAVLQMGLAKRIAWEGYLDAPVDGSYKFTVDSSGKVAIQLDGEAVPPGKPVELAAGLHPVAVEFDVAAAEPKLIVSWQPPDKTEPEVIPTNRLVCPDWTKLLTWQMTQEPQQAEPIAARLGLMVDRIDQPMATDLLALVSADSPATLPAAEVLARLLSAGHLDDTYEKTFPEQLWPLVEQADGQRQRVLVGALVGAIERLFANNGEEFDKAVKADGVSIELRDYIAERLDAEESDVAAWAMNHTGPFGLGHAGLWLERLASRDGPAVGEQHHDADLNLVDLAALTAAAQVSEGESMRWTGYLRCPTDGAYVFTIDAAQRSPVEIELAGQAVPSGKPIELPAGLHAVDVQLTIGPDAKLIVNWQKPGSEKAELIPHNVYACPAWAELLVWQLEQGPDLEQAEEICSRLTRMVGRIDQPLAERLLALIEPDAPLALPAAELLARMLRLRSASLDDEFEKTLPLQLWPFVEKAEGPRQRVLAGALIDAIGRFFANNGPEFDKAMQAEGAFQQLHDFVAERLDAQETDVAAWAMDHTGPFGLGHAGLWIERLATPAGPPVRELLHGVELNFADLAALTAAAQAREGEAVRWFGFLRCPSDGPYVFTIDAANGSPVKMEVAGQTIQSGKPIELPAGLNPVDVRLTIGADAKLVVHWQPPGSTKAELINRSVFACPAWAKLLVRQVEQGPDAEQAEKICTRLAHMVDRIDLTRAEQLLALVEPNAPLALPVGEVLARVLRQGHLDDNFDKTLPERIWPLVDKADEERQQVLVGSLVTSLANLYAKNGAEFDKAVKVPDVSQELRDFVTERLDENELMVRLWAAEHAEPFALLGSGLEGSYFDAGFKTRLFDRVDTKMQFEPGQFGYPDKRNDDMGIRWSGLLRVPADGKYVFSCVADDTCRLRLDGKPVIQDARKPATETLTAGLHEIDIEYVEKTGAERLVVYWQPPGESQPKVLEGELKRVDAVQLLLHKLARQPDDPQAVAWLRELEYKADRLAAEHIEKLAELSQDRASWRSPLARVFTATLLRNPSGAPAQAASELSKSAPTLQGTDRRQAVEALVAYLAAACGRDQAKFQQAVGSDKAYDFLCDEIRSAAASTNAADSEWADQQADILQLKLDSPDD